MLTCLPVRELADRLMAPLRVAALGCLEIVYPESCVLCGVARGAKPWCERGRRVPCLAWSDGAHLCRSCSTRIGPEPVRAELTDTGLPLIGGRRTDDQLVRVLGQMKYKGIRGVSWPLSALLLGAVSAAVEDHGAVDVLVPIPLHRRRYRRRGFNQTEILADLVGARLGITVAPGALRRCRSTDQQAKLVGAGKRRRNLSGAFRAAPDVRGAGQRRVGLVDDLVTSGATCETASGALHAGGWDVRWVAALGVAKAAEGARDPGAKR